MRWRNLKEGRISFKYIELRGGKKNMYGGCKKNPNRSSLYLRPALLLPAHLTLPRSDNPETFLKLKMRPASFAETLLLQTISKWTWKARQVLTVFRHAPRCHARLWNCNTKHANGTRTLHEHASKQASVHARTLGVHVAHIQTLETVGSYRFVHTHRTEATPSPNSDLVAKKCLFFNAGMWVFYIFDWEKKSCLYSNTQGLVCYWTSLQGLLA